ncbi:hypothetical protein F5Y00DRAFT_260288 [Daldinia vernicosa]|uniref:uncharacterized protein n=1 Tax=Daldinia vernicosa TaxID=114800 RepID=UPI002008D7BA|nr:uncharacterized protein F5Y00DRAFT_260288 [Daldinia vernicosa]KAI0850838.1 hypothetical protein F5Y00DRAFT_260288 [Daldinia vernicosa]
MATFKIDVHHHIVPPEFRKGGENPTLVGQGLRLPPWSPEKSLDFMDRHNISVSILSMGAPATSISSDSREVAAFCRRMNEYAADLCQQYPGRFGFFATLPSPEDSETCIQEIRYALEGLKAEGVSLLTSYGGKYLGHQDFRSVWDELDRLAAVVAIHPGFETASEAIQEPVPLAKPIFDWTHETTRTAAHLITTNTMKTHPACKVILPHGGGTLPYVANRIAQLGAAFGATEKTADEFLEEARHFYYDTALAGYDEPLRLSLDFAAPGHVLFGTDYPFCREDIIAKQISKVDTILEGRKDAEMVAYAAATQLWPKFKLD